MMKAKKIKEIDPFLGVFSLFGAIANPSVQNRTDVFRAEEDKWIVDTCIAFDTDTWETGINPNGECWTIVEQYEDKKEAEIGHAKWVELMRKNPEMDLEDIHVWGIA